MLLNVRNFNNFCTSFTVLNNILPIPNFNFALCLAMHIFRQTVAQPPLCCFGATKGQN